MTKECATDPDALLRVDHLQDWESRHGRIPGGALVLARTGWARLANLDQLPEAGAVVIALPSKIEGGTGSPARIVAFVSHELAAT